ncbi:MAG: hypothetical protein ACK5JE_09270 [Castellaniella sp.]|uniref:hypothetical protein n=1 Tax=Castellaniella sp. TaxID=1955812 RepID=UPI003A872BB0
MPTKSRFGLKSWMKALAGASLVILAGCQTMTASQGGSGGDGGIAPPTAASPNVSQAASAQSERPVTENQKAANLRVFLADTQSRSGWTPVTLKPSGTLYVQPKPVISRSDLRGIQSATDQKGGGVLVLFLNDAGERKMREAMKANPGLRLALVVGHTMLAAPSYTTPITKPQLGFSVGSARNAELAARAVAGVSQETDKSFEN